MKPSDPDFIRMMNEQAAMASQLQHTAGGLPRPGELRPQAAPPYQRYREMTIDELLLENRIVFLVGEIGHGSAMGVVMRLLYLSKLE